MTQRDVRRERERITHQVVDGNSKVPRSPAAVGAAGRRQLLDGRCGLARRGESSHRRRCRAVHNMGRASRRCLVFSGGGERASERAAGAADEGTATAAAENEARKTGGGLPAWTGVVVVDSECGRHSKQLIMEQARYYGAAGRWLPAAGHGARSSDVGMGGDAGWWLL